jgi:hypothetical protein
MFKLFARTWVSRVASGLLLEKTVTDAAPASHNVTESEQHNVDLDGSVVDHIASFAQTVLTGAEELAELVHKLAPIAGVVLSTTGNAPAAAVAGVVGDLAGKVADAIDSDKTTESAADAIDSDKTTESAADAIDSDTKVNSAAESSTNA